jgi:hypothetical protein
MFGLIGYKNSKPYSQKKMIRRAYITEYSKFVKKNQKG